MGQYLDVLVLSSMKTTSATYYAVKFSYMMKKVLVLSSMKTTSATKGIEQTLLDVSIVLVLSSMKTTSATFVHFLNSTIAIGS